MTIKQLGAETASMCLVYQALKVRVHNMVKMEAKPKRSGGSSGRKRRKDKRYGNTRGQLMKKIGWPDDINLHSPSPLRERNLCQAECQRRRVLGESPQSDQMFIPSGC